MRTTSTGRDIFVASALSAKHVGTLFAHALGVSNDGLLLPDSVPEQELAAWAAPSRIAVYVLEPDGDFGFKLAIDLSDDQNRPSASESFVALATAHHMTIAWAVDEMSLLDDYYVVFPSGKINIHPLHFRETEESYACLLLPAA